MERLTRDVICWSADVDESDLRTVISSGALPKGTVIKLDQVFFEKFGKENITFCQDAGYPVFVDRKISEIPDKVMKVAEVYLQYHPFMLNVMAGVCSTGNVLDQTKPLDALMRFAQMCKDAGTLSCAVTVLTSKAPELIQGEFSRDSNTQVRWYAELMQRCGMTDIVCSPLEAKMIQGDSLFNDLTVNTPGIRLPKTDVRDQARVTTPATALMNGADRLVIGSNLTDGEGEISERIRKNYARLEEHLADAGFEFADL